jgi:hypothetical protein
MPNCSLFHFALAFPLKKSERIADPIGFVRYQELMHYATGYRNYQTEDQFGRVTRDGADAHRVLSAILVGAAGFFCN